MNCVCGHPKALHARVGAPEHGPWPWTTPEPAWTPGKCFVHDGTPEAPGKHCPCQKYEAAPPYVRWVDPSNPGDSDLDKHRCPDCGRRYICRCGPHPTAEDQHDYPHTLQCAECAYKEMRA